MIKEFLCFSIIFPFFFCFLSVSLDFYEGTTQGKKKIKIFLLKSAMLVYYSTIRNLEKGHKDSIVYFKRTA